MITLKVGTLFSGGLAAVEFALRYEELEHEIVYACEWDKFARKQYEHFHRLPTSCFYEDVSFMDGTPYRDTNVMQSLLRSLYKPVSKKDTLF